MSADGTAAVPGKVFSHEELVELAKTEINENPSMIKADMKAIKDWIKKQPHLAKTSRQDEVFLITMLRGCKFSLEKTKQKIENWNTIRGMVPEFYDKWDTKDPLNAEILKLGIMLPLPGYDKHGRKVILQRLSLIDPTRCKPEDAMRVNAMITETFFEQADFQSQVCGAVVINDAVGTTMTHMKNFSPAFGKKMTTIFEEVYPSRPKAMHFLNMPSFVEGLFNLVRSFMKEKMRERIKVHPKGDYSLLQEELGKEVLPVEYGGTNGSVVEHAKVVEEHVLKRRDWLLAQTKLKSNEKKRQGMVKSYSDIFGMEGSFRQLDFD